MKKRIKMLIAAGLSVVMLTSAAGCGKKRAYGSRDQSGYSCIRGFVSFEGAGGVVFYYKCTGNINAGSE